MLCVKIEIAADYAKQNYPDFAVVVQPFFSKAKAPVEFLSNVILPYLSTMIMFIIWKS